MSDKRMPLARSSLAGNTQGEGGMRDHTASCEVWILAANHMMARALEAERWVETFAAHGVTLTPRLVSELRLLAGKDGLSLCDAAGDPIAPPRLCICRVYEPHAPRHLELLGTHCQASSRMVGLCYDKAEVTQLVAESGVPMIASEVVPAFASEHLAQGRFATPAVLKPASGRGGSHVELAHDHGELAYHLDRLIGRPGVVQPVVDKGRDLRVYVIGGEPRYAMERLGRPGDFRSNYSTGGTARPHPLDIELADLSRRVLAALPEQLPFGSVDFCLDQGQPVFCEVNANLGCRIPYEFGGYDLIGDYAEWLREECL